MLFPVLPACPPVMNFFESMGRKLDSAAAYLVRASGNARAALGEIFTRVWAKFNLRPSRVPSSVRLIRHAAWLEGNIIRAHTHPAECLCESRNGIYNNSRASQRAKKSTCYYNSHNDPFHAVWRQRESSAPHALYHLSLLAAHCEEFPECTKSVL